MNQKTYLETLEGELQKNQVANIAEILSDYREHFSHAKEAGKSEEEIAENLGNPASIARAYETQKMISEVKEVNTKFEWQKALQIIGRLLLVAPMNFFIFFIPGMIIFSMLIAGWSLVIGLGGGLFAFIGFMFSTGVMTGSTWGFLASFSSFFAGVGLAVVTAMSMFYISKNILLAIINYLQWNLDFIKNK